MAYWLMKSEPDCFSIDDLATRPNKTEKWDGVRNYQVRNMFRDQFKKGDQAFFYHSSCEVPGVVGLMKVVSNAYPDPTQFDPKADHYDPKSTPENPRWLLVDVQFQRKLKNPVTLAQLREHESGKLKGLLVLAPGSRLSVTPVKPEHWDFILSLAG
ncbi:Predicted RNA-binding protein, contains PUA-like domain [Solimonas aquatica]|uniref:Predicted RNA-binding protein, contains PUA-like domain n=1 Tax=Solimonas aquatica TaxID=489703 RepID=A0A1H9LFB1_9GAMM|nr:Predicted RNA-binding protein, contains PUA-like domain [Solimonas aquatica]